MTDEIPISRSRPPHRRTGDVPNDADPDNRPRTTRRRPARGSLAPFETVLERHGPAVLRFCVARLGPDRGEEAFQETLLAAMRHYEDLRDPDAVGGWLFSIAQRKIVDTARSRAREPVPSDAVDDRAAVWIDPDRDDEVWARVARLPPKQREAIGLRFLGDLSHQDVAHVMGISTEAARRNVFEGLTRLRKDLADDRDDL